jgi:hypothetical protein
VARVGFCRELDRGGIGKKQVLPRLKKNKRKKSSTGSGKRMVSKKVITRVMTEIGRRGGKVGGKRCLETMTREQRTLRAFKAAKVRWNRALPPERRLLREILRRHKSMTPSVRKRKIQTLCKSKSMENFIRNYFPELLLEIRK